MTLANEKPFSFYLRDKDKVQPPHPGFEWDDY